jgi:threonine dehydrogenase-like Zn-dependent dehydrogenase
MRALYLDNKLSFRKNFSRPEPAHGESLIRVTMAGICGTDIELTRGYMAYRGIPGHEFVGRVEESAEPDLVGRRVVGEINAACGLCQWCRMGLGRHCPNRTVLGIVGRNGTFAEYITLPNQNLLTVPDSVPDNVAVMCEPLAAAYEIFEQVKIDPAERIAILGDGRLGAVAALALKAEGFEPIVGGRHQDKLNRLAALEIKVSLEKYLTPGFDIVIEATGRPPGFNRAVELVRPRGRLILKSTAAVSAPLNLAPVVVNEITLIGSRCGRFSPALDSLAAGRTSPLSLVTAVYPLEDGAQAIDASASPANFKVLLQIA